MKREISQQFALLRDYGFTVINFNSKSKFSAGLRGFVDYVIFDKTRLIFIEVKIGKDKYSKAQEDTKVKLSSIAEYNPAVYYHLVSDLSRAIVIVNDLIIKGGGNNVA